MEMNRTIEYLGLAKSQLVDADIKPLFTNIGRQPFPAEQVDNHLAEIKKRDQIIEKNKKLKSSKKPEEPVPFIDPIE